MSAGDAPLVLVVGDVIDDVIVRPLAATAYGSDTPASIQSTPGGSGANQAAWLAASGTRVRFVGRVGAADLDRHARALTDAGVEARLVADEAAPTGTIVILVAPDGERTMYTDRGANLRLCADDLPDAVLDGVAALHLSGYALFDPVVRAVVLHLVDRARRRGLPVSIDPSSTGFLSEVGPADFLDWVVGTDVLFPNLDEGRLLSGEYEPAAVAAALLDHVPLIALTLGADGALVAARGTAPAYVPSVDVEVVDTTGAGDAFCGAFLGAWLAGGDPTRSAERGVAAAAGAVQVLGARPDRR